jgi:ArsR family transcriptional regulator, virulence genes transcriptional regulator
MTAKLGVAKELSMDQLDLTPGLKPAARLLKALANERRLAILCQLGAGEMSVGALGERVGLGSSALSQHLAKLRADGLVKTRKKAQTVFYSSASAEATAIIAILTSLFCNTPPKSGESS